MIAEEVLELTGVVIFIHALLVYLRGYEPAVTLAVAPVVVEDVDLTEGAGGSSRTPHQHAPPASFVATAHGHPDRRVLN